MHIEPLYPLTTLPTLTPSQVFSQPSRFATLEQEREEEEREGGKATPEKEAGPQNTEDV